MTTILVIGASGVVGSGIVLNSLKKGFKVVAASRKLSKLHDLKEKLVQNSVAVSNLELIEVDFSNEENAKRALEQIKKHNVDHVYSVQGFADVGNIPSETALEDLNKSFENGLFNNFLASKVLLPELKQRSTDCSLTIVSGGFAHFCPDPAMWRATIKNAAVNGLVLGLAQEAKGTKLRVNSACIHFGVAAFGGDKNQFGFDSVDTARVGAVLVKFFSSSKQGEVVCLETIEKSEALKF